MGLRRVAVSVHFDSFMQPAPTTKIRKLEPSESLAMLQGPLVDPQASDDDDAGGGEAGKPLKVRVAVQRLRLVLSAAVMVVVIVALTLIMRHGIVIQRFERRDVSIKQQEALLEKYNAYSGTITGAIERPVEVFLGFVVPVFVLRMLTDDVLSAQSRWRLTATGLVVGAISTYLLTNGLSAVNVQVREQPVEMTIKTEDLAITGLDVTVTTTENATFAEDQAMNPVGNTILRGLVLQPPTPPYSMNCDDSDGDHRVEYRIPQRSWMKDLIPTALAVKSMRLEIAETNPASNEAVATDQFPMNASVATELLMYSLYDQLNGSAWGTQSLYESRYYSKAAMQSVQKNNATEWKGNYTYVPITRLTNLLPTNSTSTEQDDRAWFLQHAAPEMYRHSTPETKNASQLRSWNMTLSHIDIEPDVLWMDAVTIEREMASPRLGGNKSYTIVDDQFKDFKLIRKAEDVLDDRIDLYMVCADANGSNAVVVELPRNSTIMSGIKCVNRSINSLLVVSRGHRLVADRVASFNATTQVTVVNNTAGKYSLQITLTNESWSDTSTFFSDVNTSGSAVSTGIINLREIFSVTVARLSWKVQNLSAIYNAKCDASGGCMGLDVALGSRQRLVVSESALPLKAPTSVFDLRTAYTPSYVMYAIPPPPLVSVRRPTRVGTPLPFDLSSVGDILMPNSVRNKTSPWQALRFRSNDCARDRLATILNNHIYMEHTLQPTYTAAALFLLQSGVVRDVLNQSTASQQMLAFNGNTQDVQVYVYIPRLNVIISLVGCVLLLVAIALVVLWPHRSDRLTRITNPHEIANVLLNEKAFPPLLLDRSVAPSEALDAFQIQSLTLWRTTDTATDASPIQSDVVHHETESPNRIDHKC